MNFNITTNFSLYLRLLLHVSSKKCVENNRQILFSLTYENNVLVQGVNSGQYSP